MSDLPDKPPGSNRYLPPPPDPGDESPSSLRFPRMDPPPASLEAMMRKGPRSPFAGVRSSAWLLVLALAAAVAVAAYVLGLHR